MKQISIVVEDREDFLAEITDLMAENNVNIETIEVETVGDSSIVIMTVDKYDLALKKLRDASFNAITEDCLLLKLKDEPGALAKIARKFRDAHINIRGVHIISRDGAVSIVAISVKRTDKALELVKDVLVS
jgi:hypothetical protein